MLKDRVCYFFNGAEFVQSPTPDPQPFVIASEDDLKYLASRKYEFSVIKNGEEYAVMGDLNKIKKSLAYHHVYS